MKRGLLLALAGSLAMLSAEAVDPRQRSDSSSRQFTVYCEDTALRQRVASFAEEVKGDLIRLLGEERDTDRWRAPIVITLAPRKTAEYGLPPVVVRPVQSDFGFRVEIQVRIGSDPADVFLQKQILRALLLTYSYGSAGIKPDEVFVEAPWWVVEGALQMFRRRDQGVDTALFKKLVATGLLPPIDEFLIEKPPEIGPTALAMDHSCAMALLDLLIEQPRGRGSLAQLIRDWPRGTQEPIAALAAAFPALTDRETIQRWWTVSIARLAAADRYTGLTLDETDRELTEKLRVTVTIDKAGKRRTFDVSEYRDFVKLKSSRDALLASEKSLVALGASANPLFRPVIAEYQQIVTALAAGKTRGIDERLAKVATYRQQVIERMAKIIDYLNWYEATQIGTRTGAFDNYLKTVREIEKQEGKASEQITKYLDQLEGEL